MVVLEEREWLDDDVVVNADAEEVGGKSEGGGGGGGPSRSLLSPSSTSTTILSFKGASEAIPVDPPKLLATLSFFNVDVLCNWVIYTSGCALSWGPPG